MSLVKLTGNLLYLEEEGDTGPHLVAGSEFIGLSWKGTGDQMWCQVSHFQDFFTLAISLALTGNFVCIREVGYQR